jgi:NAD(P)-dependent dehydrogenase (short-subunit alcohol dehydrogenase family)
MPEKVAVVTGCSAGIGRSIAIALAKKDYVVIGNSRKEDERAKSLLVELRQYSKQSKFVAGDLSNESAAAEFCRVVAELVPGVDVLINNAGRTEPTFISPFDAAAWRAQFDENFFSAVFVTSGLLRLLQESKGSIVNISSVRGLFDTGREGVMAYSAAKAALNSFTTTLAKALAPNVTVNAILPGFTATTYLERSPADQVAAWKESSLIRRFIEPNEIADITLSVAENRAITGSLILVDGGLALKRG